MPRRIRDGSAHVPPANLKNMVRVDPQRTMPLPPPLPPGEQSNSGFIAPTPSQFATDADLRAQRVSKGGTWIPLFPAPPQAHIATGATAASQAKVATKQVPQVKVGTSSSGAATIAVTPAASPSNPAPLPGPAIPIAKNQDQLPDGLTFGRVVNTALTSNQPDFSKPGFLNKNLDNIADTPTFARLLHVNADNTFHVSTSFNNNGNVPASALNNGFLTIKLGSVGGSSVVLQWGGSQAGLMDGSFINMGIGSFSAPAAPTLSQHAGGTRGATTLFVRVALVRDNMILAVGPEASIAVSANNQITVTSPSSVAGLDGWIPLIGTSTLNEFVPTDRASGIGLHTIAFGTNYSEPSGGVAFSGQACSNWAVPLSTAAATSTTPTNCLLAASTTYFFYPSYDLVNQMLCFPAATGFIPGLATAKNAFLAIAQCGDQRIALSTGAASFTTPASGSTSSTTGGGGGGGGRALQ